MGPKRKYSTLTPDVGSEESKGAAEMTVRAVEYSDFGKALALNGFGEKVAYFIPMLCFCYNSVRAQEPASSGGSYVHQCVVVFYYVVPSDSVRLSFVI